MKNSTKYKAWRVIIDSIEGVEVKEDIENNQVVAIKENDIVGLFDLELDAGSIKESNENLMEMARIGSNRSGIDGVVIWVGESPDSHGPRIKVSNLKNKWDKQNNFTLSLPDLAVKAGQPEKWIPLEDIRDFLKLNMDSIVSYEKEGYDTDVFLDSLVPISGSIKESWLSDDYVTWIDDSSKAKTFTQAEAEIVAKQVNGLASPRFPDGEETDSYVVSNINQYESTELQVRNTFHNRDTHPFYLKIDENGQWWIVNKRTGKQHKPSKNDKETAREEAKAMRENDPFVEPIKEAALPDKDMIGGFRELSVGKNFWYGKTRYDWALKHDLPHEIVSDHGNRYARVLNTVAYVAVDENDDGTPKLEKWYIKHFQKKED